MWALFIGFFTAVCVFFVPEVMRHLGADDRLDVFAVHGVGGMIGAALTGLFANGSYSAPDPYNYSGVGGVNPGHYGSFYGNAVLLGKQCASISATILFAAVGTSVIFCFVWAVGRAFGESVAIAPHKQEDVDAKLHRAAAYSRRGMLAPGLAMPYSPSLVGLPSPSPAWSDTPAGEGGSGAPGVSRDGPYEVPPLDLGKPAAAAAAAVSVAPAAPAAAAPAAATLLAPATGSAAKP